MNKRIVVTGMGAVTPLGNSVDSYWEALISGKSGIDMIKEFDASSLDTRFAGEVKGFKPEDFLPKKLIKNTERFSQLAYAAASAAILDAGLVIEPERTGITLGTAIAGIRPIADTQEMIALCPDSKIGPRFVPKLLGNIAASNIAIYNHIYGPSITISTACASGGDAIKTACMMLCSGEADTMVTVGAESAACALMIRGLTSVSALSKNNDNASSASRPFDKARDGLVVGEGGGALILETEEHALRRNARIIAEIKGCASNNDAYHPMAPHPEGLGAQSCMKKALMAAGLSAEDIGYINAHGTATLKGDVVEIHAINEVFGKASPSVSSTKGATGHMMGAGGITEIITCVKAIESGILPPTINLDHIDPECLGPDLIPKYAKKQNIDYAMSNAFGFGGQNSTVVVGRYRYDSSF